MKKRNLDIIEFLLWAGIMVLLNIVVSQYFFRIDLTADKRYTISSSSKEALKGLNDKVYIEIYLTGELPSEYKRFEKSIRETLDEFRIYAGEKIQYKFFDPNSEEDQQKKSRIYEYLSKKGIKPTSITTEDGVKYVFPAALLVYKEKELPIILLNGNRVEGEGEMVNQSIEGLEYEFISGIKQLSLKNKKSVAIVQGHDEYDPPSLAEISKSIAQFYNIYGIDLKNVKELDNYDALIIARPEKKFTEEEKYILDQYIMKGGNVLFFMDALRVNLDSIGDIGTLAVPYDNNLDDLIFRYGLRINADLIQDMQATQIPLYVGETGDQPQVTMMPWRYFPLLNNFGD
ncbi:MAG: Gldg family protein, partial [Cytophagaceae bacterium]|nr:Gldg family protein [Cytophagaceae bacterium]